MSLVTTVFVKLALRVARVSPTWTLPKARTAASVKVGWATS